MDNFKHNKRSQKVSYWSFLKTHERLRALIDFTAKRKKISRVELSRMIGVHKYQVSNYLNRKFTRSLSDYHIILLAQKLGIEVTLTMKFLEDE